MHSTVMPAIRSVKGSKHPWFRRRALIVTKHGKERVIMPLLQHTFAMQVELLLLDTDVHGTFTGEVPRTGSAKDALQRKIADAFPFADRGDVVVASEGSFFHDMLGAVDVELVAIHEVGSESPVVGKCRSYDTNAARFQIRDDIALQRAIAVIGLPSHGAVLRVNGPVFEKGIHEAQVLKRLAQEFLEEGAAVEIESDMRAYHNPRRMRMIARACADAIRSARVFCPACGEPGFRVVEAIAGALCEWCRTPTTLAKAYRSACRRCGFESVSETGTAYVEQRWCPYCNP
ncbi:MAG: DUF6671 family protein [Vulcanimicrobiaceae bacterium]